MLYRAAAAISLGLIYSASGFSPAPIMQPRSAAAAISPLSALRMDVTETVDMTGGEVRQNRELFDEDLLKLGRRSRPTSIDWSNLRARLEVEFKIPEDTLKKYDEIASEDLEKAYEMMQLCRQFENACNQAYMQGNIRGFMHLDNGQVRLLTLHSNKLAPAARYTLSRCSFFIRHRRRRSRRGLPTRSRRATSSIRTTASTPTRSRRASTPAR